VGGEIRRHRRETSASAGRAAGDRCTVPGELGDDGLRVHQLA
jgi:hypothetical protein